MSVPTYTNAREFLEGVHELEALVQSAGVERMYDVLTAIVDYAERKHAHELAERIRERSDEIRAEDWGRSRGKRTFLTGMEVARKLVEPEVPS